MCVVYLCVMFCVYSDGEPALKLVVKLEDTVII